MEKFSYPRPNLVVSSDGFSVEVLGRTGLRYREADREMFIDSEVLATDEPTIATWASAMRGWDAPHDREAIPPEERSRILENIQRAFAWKGWHLQTD